MKKPWQSKTVWTNLIMAALAFAPGVKEHVTPEVMAMLFMGVNWILRYVTKSEISFTE